jgi:hypothetical protein
MGYPTSFQMLTHLKNEAERININLFGSESPPKPEYRQRTTLQYGIFGQVPTGQFGVIKMIVTTQTLHKNFRQVGEADYKLHETVRQINLLAHLDFEYHRSKKYTFYSGMGGGAAVKNRQDFIKGTKMNFWKPIFSCTLIGVHGNKRIQPFAELGIGTTGLLCVGMKCRFNGIK